MSKNESIITVTSLRGYFFDRLNELNKKALCPIPQEALYYSSEVLDKYMLAQEFHEISDGKIRDKILGTKLLEALQHPREEQKKIYKDVGDTALVLCGYFSESVNKKIVDTHYYAQVGKTAYTSLNGVVPKLLDIPSFYSMLSTCFVQLTDLISILAMKDRLDNDQHLIFKKQIKLSQEELIVLPEKLKKAN